MTRVPVSWGVRACIPRGMPDVGCSRVFPLAGRSKAAAWLGAYRAFRGFDGILKVIAAIKDRAHGLGARRGRLCDK